MERAAFLLDLSREHHLALSLAHQVRKALKLGHPGEIREIGHDVSLRFQTELAPHFAKEEFELLPFLLAQGEVELVERTRAEHRALTELAGQIVREVSGAAAESLGGLLLEFAELLVSHVRFEERQLFERAQQLDMDDDRIFS